MLSRSLVTWFGTFLWEFLDSRCSSLDTIVFMDHSLIIRISMISLDISPSHHSSLHTSHGRKVTSFTMLSPTTLTKIMDTCGFRIRIGKQCHHGKDGSIQFHSLDGLNGSQCTLYSVSVMDLTSGHTLHFLFVTLNVFNV